MGPGTAEFRLLASEPDDVIHNLSGELRLAVRYKKPRMHANSAVVSSQFASAIDEGVSERSDIGKLQYSAQLRARGKVVDIIARNTVSCRTVRALMSVATG